MLIIARRSYTYFFLRSLLASKNEHHRLDSGIGRSAVAVIIRIFIPKFYESSIKLVLWNAVNSVTERGTWYLRLQNQKGVLFQWMLLFTIVRRLWSARVSNSYTPLFRWLGVLSRENYFCSIVFFYGLTSHGPNSIRGFFRASHLEVLYANCFRTGLFPFSLCLSLSFSGIP